LSSFFDIGERIFVVCLGTKLLEELERQLLMGNLFGIQTKQAM
jgi:hypothetical protein